MCAFECEPTSFVLWGGRLDPFRLIKRHISNHGNIGSIFTESCEEKGGRRGIFGSGGRL